MDLPRSAPTAVGWPFALVDVFGGLHLPTPVIVVLGIALTGTLSLAQSWVAPRQIAALDAAAGPVTNAPAPRRRLTAAAQAGSTPAPALF